MQSYMGKSKPCKCRNCGREFLEWPCRRGFYCSVSCSGKSQVGVKLSKSKRGENNPNWRGGVSGERLKLIDSINYRQWRKDVFERDNYTCRKCSKRGVRLNADHIIPYFKDRAKIYDLDNGQTLCYNCHLEKTRQEMQENWVNQYSSH